MSYRLVEAAENNKKQIYVSQPGYSYTTDGQIESITDGRGTTTYSYDERNRLVSCTDPGGPTLASRATIEYGYDERDRLATVIDADYNLTAYATVA